MTRNAAFVLLLAGCDYTFVTHVRVEVRAGGAPLADAWVLACGEAERTDANGIAALERADFLGGPCQTPIFVVAPGLRSSATFLEAAGGSAEVADHGVGCGGPPEGVEETWTGRVELAPEPAERGLGSTCGVDRRCTMVVPDLSAGDVTLTLVVSTDAEAPRLLQPIDVARAPAGAGALRVDFTLPAELPQGARVSPFFTWHRRVAIERSGRRIEGVRLRDAVGAFGDPITAG